MGRFNKEEKYLLKLNQRRSTQNKEVKEEVEQSNKCNTHQSEEEEGQIFNEPTNVQNNPSKYDFERVIRTIGSKDELDIFKEPVTEKMAPGYFEVVKEPMDLTTMRLKAKNDQYTGWASLEKDFDVMFQNAMIYNEEETIFHKQAIRLKNVTHKLIELSKQGVTDFRGHITVVMREENRREFEEEHGVIVEPKPKKEKESMPAQPRKSQKRNAQAEQPHQNQDQDNNQDGSKPQHVGKYVRTEAQKRTRNLNRQIQKELSKYQGAVDEYARMSYLQRTQQYKEQAGSLGAGLTPYGLELQDTNSTLQLRESIKIAEYIQSRLAFAEELEGPAKDYVINQITEALNEAQLEDPQLENDLKINDNWQFNFSELQDGDFSQADYQMMDLDNTNDGVITGKNNMQISVLRNIYDDPFKSINPYDPDNDSIPLVATMVDHFHLLSEEKHSIQYHYNMLRQFVDGIAPQYV